MTGPLHTSTALEKHAEDMNEVQCCWFHHAVKQSGQIVVQAGARQQYVHAAPVWTHTAANSKDAPTSDVHMRQLKHLHELIVQHSVRGHCPHSWCPGHTACPAASASLWIAVPAPASKFMLLSPVVRASSSDSDKQQ